MRFSQGNVSTNQADSLAGRFSFPSMNGAVQSRYLTNPPHRCPDFQARGHRFHLDHRYFLYPHWFDVIKLPFPGSHTYFSLLLSQ
jgi:hypothetical protein